MHSVASRQLTGGNIVHLVLPSVIVSGANSAICSNGQTLIEMNINEVGGGGGGLLLQYNQINAHAMLFKR